MSPLELLQASQKWISLNINLESLGPAETKCWDAFAEEEIVGRDVESYTPISLEDSFDSSLLSSQALYRGDGKTMSFGGSVDVVTT
ncbi:hypothetical protein Bca101_037455 [Brassica carinata]